MTRRPSTVTEKRIYTSRPKTIERVPVDGLWYTVSPPVHVLGGHYRALLDHELRRATIEPDADEHD